MQLCKRSLFVHELVKMVNELDATRALAAVRSLISLGLSCLCAKYMCICCRYKKFTKSHSRSAFCTRSIHHWCLSSYIDFVWSGHVTGVATWSQLNAYITSELWTKWRCGAQVVYGFIVIKTLPYTTQNSCYIVVSIYGCFFLWILFSSNIHGYY